MRRATRSSPPQVRDGASAIGPLELPETDDPRVAEVLGLCRAFIDGLVKHLGHAVRDARLRVAGGHVRLAVVVTEEMLGLTRSLAPTHPMLSVFAIVNVAPTPSDVAPLTDEDRSFLDYLIEGALASWMLET